MIKRGSEEFSGYNKPKKTPNHPKKSHAVLAKSGDEVFLVVLMDLKETKHLKPVMLRILPKAK
jgi:hypothetical protein